MIRPMRSDDLPRIRQLHAECGFKWELPTFEEPEIIETIVYTDENDVPVLMIGSRKAAEVYMLMDKSFGTPGERNAAFTGTYMQLQSALYAQGFREAIAWLPPSIEKTFFRRLRAKFGWYRSSWNVFLTRIAP